MQVWKVPWEGGGGSGAAGRAAEGQAGRAALEAVQDEQSLHEHLALDNHQGAPQLQWNS